MAHLWLFPKHSFECVKLHISDVISRFYKSKKADKFSTGVDSVAVVALCAHIQGSVCSFCNSEAGVFWFFVASCYFLAKYMNRF